MRANLTEAKLRLRKQSGHTRASSASDTACPEGPPAYYSPITNRPILWHIDTALMLMRQAHHRCTLAGVLGIVDAGR